MTDVPAITFAAVAQLTAARGWRPFPGLQTTKVPAMAGWSGLNLYEWDEADLAAAVTDFQPADDYACCFAVQREIVAIDADIIDSEHAAFANKLADDTLGETPLLRMGFQPKCVRIYRTDDLIKIKENPSTRNFLRLWSDCCLRLARESRSSLPLAARIPAHHQHR